MKWTTTITGIGSEAISEKDDLVILFGEQATDEIKEVAVIHRFDDKHVSQNFTFKNEDIVIIDGRVFSALYVGAMVVSNIKAIAHAVLVFTDKIPKHPMQNTIYLDKPVSEPMPKFDIGSEIVFEHK